MAPAGRQGRVQGKRPGGPRRPGADRIHWKATPAGRQKRRMVTRRSSPTQGRGIAHPEKLAMDLSCNSNFQCYFYKRDLF